MKETRKCFICEGKYVVKNTSIRKTCCTACSRKYLHSPEVRKRDRLRAKQRNKIVKVKGENKKTRSLSTIIKSRQYQKLYRDKPENKEKKRLYDLQPDVRKKRSIYLKKRNAQPEIKKKAKEYRIEYEKRPGVKDMLRQYSLAYDALPENKNKKKKYRRKRYLGMEKVMCLVT